MNEELKELTEKYKVPFAIMAFGTVSLLAFAAVIGGLEIFLLATGIAGLIAGVFLAGIMSEM